jgi:AcrR family transcriptional regulator
VKASPSAIDKDSVSHNLLGQRLGRKGRDTRERIVAATERLLTGPAGEPITLSAVAREASLGMTTLYLYFSDLPELLLAAMEPVMASAEQSYVGQLRAHWPDDELAERCLSFVEAFHAFWVRHSRILHMRNAYADARDERMVRYRIESSVHMIELFMRQMEDDPSLARPPIRAMATVLLTGVERLITVTTDTSFPALTGEDAAPHVRGLLLAEARLLELAIRDGRAACRGQTGSGVEG